MKFHTTLKDIIISILVLLCCTVAIGWGIANLGMSNPSQVIATTIIERLDGNGEVRIVIGQVGRSYLKTLTAGDITVSVQGQEILHIDEVRIAGGLGRVAWALVSRRSDLRVEIDGVVSAITVDLSSLALSPHAPAASTLSRVLDRLDLHLSVNDASLSVAASEGDITLSEASFSVHMDRGLSNTTLAGQGSGMRFSTRDTHGLFDQLRFGLDEEGRVGLEADRVRIEEGGGLSITGNQIVAAYHRSGELSLSAQDVDLISSNLAVQIPQLAGRGLIDGTKLVDYTLSVTALELESSPYHLKVPTTTFSGRIDEEHTRHTIAIASRSEERFTFKAEDLAALNAHSLAAHFFYDEERMIQGELTLSNIEWEDGVELDSVVLSLLSLDVLSWDAQANLVADLKTQVPYDLGSLTSPVSASLGYQRSEGTITASLSLDEADTTLIDSPFDLHLSYQGRRDVGQLQAELSIPDQAALSALYNRGEEQSVLVINGRLTELMAKTFTPIVDARAQFLKPYVQQQTTLSGNISFNGREEQGRRQARLSTELALIDASIGRLNVDAGLTFLGSLEGEKLTVNSLTLATSGYRLAFNGETEINYWLPRGHLSFYRVDDGQLLAEAMMVDRPPAGYEFSISTALEPVITIDGEVARRKVNTLTGEAILGFGTDRTPFTFSLATDTLALSVQQEQRLMLHASLTPPQALTVRGDRFALPGGTATFSGTVDATFFSVTDWSLQSEDFTLSDVSFKGHRYNLAAPFSAQSRALSIPSFTIADEGGAYTGSLSYQGIDLAHLKASRFVAPYVATLNLEDLIQISLLSNTDVIEVTATLANVPIDRLSDDTNHSSLSLSMVGSTDLAQTISLDGMVDYHTEKSGFSTRFALSDRTIELFDGRYYNGELSITAEEARFSDGEFTFIGSFDHIRHLDYIDQPSHLSVSLHLPLDGVHSVFDLVRTNRSLFKGPLEATLSIDDVLLFGEGGIADGTYVIGWEEGRLSVGSELLSLAYDTTTKHINFVAKPEFGIGFTIYGSLARDDFGISLTDLYLPLTMLNRTFLKPIFLFRSGFGEGEIFLSGSPEAIRPYGQLHVNATEMFVFWLPDDKIHMKGVSITIDGNRATTGRVPFFSTNTKTGRTVHGYGDLSAHFDGLTLLNYEIHADSLDAPVFVWIPMAGYEADIQGYAIGTFNLFGIGFQTWLDGDVTISDMNMTLGIKGLPEWYVPAYLTTTRFNVTTAKGVNFYYPNTPTPFIKATLTENQKFSFTYDHLADEFELDGVFSFRSGEIFYFQKNFFITEGSMVLHTDAISGRNAIIPRINLRAKVTDFDSLGNRVDIFLVLRDSTLTSLNPQFESIPALEVNEIMEILGQSILPSGAYGEIGLYSVASLAAAATDVAERLGLLEVSQTAHLTEAIRLSLGMDMFSIRSNIVQNILFDALPVTGLMGSLSPIARYLHNTSIFMGKYIGTNFFLQALVHLSAMERGKVATSFLSPDLSIDLELSVDWENPLATVSFFTQPHELSFTNILDTMGFSVTKRIVLR